MKAVFGFALLLAVSVGTSVVSAQNYKIKQRMIVSGQTMETTIYVKDSRQRTESGGMMGMNADVATIQQCDLKRNVLVNDKKKLYVVDAFSLTDGSGVATDQPAVAGKVVKGGTVTMNSSLVDTGERKQMFGLTARRIKTTMTMVSSADACSKVDTKMETDGWYVDLPQFFCPVNTSNNAPAIPSSKGGCQDRMIVKNSGTAKLGFPLEMTQTMWSGGTQAFAQNIETIEFSRAKLEDSLFNIPSDYTLATSSQDLYGVPDMSAIRESDRNNRDSNAARSEPPARSEVRVPAKRPGVKRIGVLTPVNNTSEAFSIPDLQSYLVGRLNSSAVEAVAVSSEAEARKADCDLVLGLDVSKLKQSAASKVGGLFGKVTGTDTSAVQNYEAQVDYKMMSLADGRSVLQNKASKKTSGNADSAVRAVLEMTAAAALKAVN